MERCNLTRNRKVRILEPVLRPDAQSARRLGGRSVAINDAVLADGGAAMRAAIARLAPQVPREW